MRHFRSRASNGKSSSLQGPTINHQDPAIRDGSYQAAMLSHLSFLRCTSVVTSILPASFSSSEQTEPAFFDTILVNAKEFPRYGRVFRFLDIDVDSSFVVEAKTAGKALETRGRRTGKHAQMMPTFISTEVQVAAGVFV